MYVCLQQIAATLGVKFILRHRLNRVSGTQIIPIGITVNPWTYNSEVCVFTLMQQKQKIDSDITETVIRVDDRSK
jgi:hypothetical protein